jgi:hypothetical protein
LSEGILIEVNEKGSEKVVKTLEDLSRTMAALSSKAAYSLRGAALRVRVNTDKLVSAVALKTLQVVVQKTPIDTGAAKGHWHLSVGTSPEVPEANMASFDNPETVVSKGLAVLTTMQRQPGESVFIVNPLPYIVALDKGWSTQAPAGMTAQALQAGRAVASNKKILT